MQGFVYLLLLLGVIALVCSGVMLVATYRYRERNTRGVIAFGIVVAFYFAVCGTLWVVAFAVPSARTGATLTAAFVMIAWGVGVGITARVVQWRDTRRE